MQLSLFIYRCRPCRWAGLAGTFLIVTTAALGQVSPAGPPAKDAAATTPGAPATPRPAPVTSRPAPVATRPAPVPSRPAPVATPPGFVRIDAGRVTVICAAADAAWVRPLAAAAGPATRPATGPAELIDRLTDRRAELVAAVRRDLGPIGDAAFDELIDTDLLPGLARRRDYRPAVVYLFGTRDQFRAAMAAGWDDPHVRLNRATNEVEVNFNIPFGPDSAGGETYLPMAYDAAAAPGERGPVRRPLS